ncbi:hypothetical protein BDC45DRAFT_539205 [Circinella umbellata]|nr:hypothetical protein BDC45DRAFT_539205 [Circinella umbellata]
MKPLGHLVIFLKACYNTIECIFLVYMFKLLKLSGICIGLTTQIRFLWNCTQLCFMMLVKSILDRLYNIYGEDIIRWIISRNPIQKKYIQSYTRICIYPHTYTPANIED